MAYSEKTLLVSGLTRKPGMDRKFPIVDSTAVYVRDRTSEDLADERDYYGLDEALSNIGSILNNLDYTDRREDHEFVILVNQQDGKISVEHVVPVIDDISGLKDALDTINQRLDDLEYQPMDIASFSIFYNNEDIGDTLKIDKGGSVSNITLKWELIPNGKDPVSIKINNSAITPLSTREKLYSGPFTSDTSWTLNVKDNRDNPTEDKTVYLKFMDRVYWGSKPVPNTYDQAFIKSLQNNDLYETHPDTFTADAGYSDYIYYACPNIEYNDKFYTPEFHFNEFEVNLSKVATRVQLKNANNQTSYYDIYRSLNKNLGETTYRIKEEV